MIVHSSRSVRRLVGRLDRGQDLGTALLDVCRAHDVRTAEIRALGSFETVELAEYDQAARVWKPSRTFTGGFELLQLTGNVSLRGGELALHAHVTIMRDRDAGIEVLGGHLVGARVFALEFVLDAMDDVVLERAPDRDTGLVLWASAAPTAAPASPKSAPAPASPVPGPTSSPGKSATGWGQVIAASAAAEPAKPDEESNDELRIGDLLNHPAFGRVEVQRVESEFVHVRGKSGRLIRLSLDVIKLIPAGTENGKRVYRVRVDG